MSLYFEHSVNFPEANSISVNVIWHPSVPLLAVSSYSQERGGFVIVFDEHVSIIKQIFKKVTNINLTRENL